MVFEIVDKSLAGRIGKIYTKHGVIETPTLFPVVSVNYSSHIIDWIKKLNYNAIITNAYLLWKKTNKMIVDVHEYFNFHYPIMTDSGGYQILKYGDVEISPEESLQYQIAIKSDIGVILDYPTGLTANYDLAKKSVMLTIERAKKAKEIKKDSSDFILVAPIQGGFHLELLKYCSKSLKELDYEMYAIGSPTGLMEKYEYWKVAEMILYAKKILGPSKIIHLFGAGHPSFFPFIVALGVDTFDSAAYSLYAKDGRYMTRTRTYHINELTYLPCNCDVCRKIDVNELKSMDIKERVLLLEKHNLYVSLEEIKHIKLHISEGTFWNYLEEKARSHYALYKTLLFLKKHINFIEKYNPLTKVNVRGLYFFDNLSSITPDVILYYKLIVERFKLLEESILIVLPYLNKKPFFRTREVSLLKNILASIPADIFNRIQIVFTGLPFVIIPLELSEVYPLSQWEGKLISFPYSKLIDKTLQEIIFKANIKKIIIIENENNKLITEKIKKYYENLNIPILYRKCNNIYSFLIKNKDLLLDFLIKN